MIYLFDKHWQLPARTEREAYESLNDIDLMNVDSDSLYIAFPWANLIDAIDHNWDSKNMYLSMLQQISDTVSQENYKNIFTTCQHVWAFRDRHRCLFESCGINKIFWPHKPHDPSKLTNVNGHKLYKNNKVQAFIKKFDVSPHHLFPVQANWLADEADYFSLNKKYLASFSGMVNCDYYFCDDREQIMRCLPQDKNFYTKDTGDWFYSKNVYKNKRKIPSNNFSQLLLNSVFSLCPPGTGVNSIRFWESINLGSIPVLFESRHDLIEINSCKWSDCCIFYEDYESVANLSSHLKNFSVKEIQQKQEALFEVAREISFSKNQNLIKYYLDDKL
jgi:hypothetical protein